MASDTKRGAVPEYVDYRPDDEAGSFWLHMPRLRRLLASQGLHVVTAAEKAVLDAMAKARLCHENRETPVFDYFEDTVDVARAELARRETAK